MPLILIVTALSALLAVASAKAAQPSPPAGPAWTNCLDVLRLSPEVASRNLPVRLSGRITCYIPASQLCFLQDASGGVYIYPSRWPRDLFPGDIVEVEGDTGTGRFSSIVQNASFKKTGRTESIVSKAISIEELNTGRHDCQVVELEGIVQSFTVGGDNVAVVLNVGGSSARVLIFGDFGGLTNLVDARIRVQGVAGTFYDGGGILTGFGVFANGPADLQVLKPASDPFSAPLRSIERLHYFAPDATTDHRMRLRGVVTVVWPGEAFYIQSGARAIRAIPAERSSMEGLAPGDEVEVSGFVPPLHARAEMRQVLVRKIGTQMVTPLKLAPEQLLSNNVPVLVSTEGVVIRSHAGGISSMLVLDADGRIFPAFLRGRDDLPQNGSRVRVNGVWDRAPSIFGPGTAAGLWLSSGNSLEVVAPPAQRAENPGGTASSLALIGAAAWALTFTGLAVQSKRVANEKSRELQLARERAQENERELEVLQQGRERLGRDLHDSVIQAIYAVGLNLDDCSQQVRSNPERVENRLRSAMGDINAVIRELRNVILGLETSAIQPKEFRTALKSLSLALGHEKSNRMRLDIDQSAIDWLNPSQATELIHIAREALSNSLRHGQAATTTFALRLADERVRFSIEDDGCGFSLESAHRKGFGLRNMAKRAENLGAEFTISSQPGGGTRILLDIPRQKQHFSVSEPNPRSDR